MAVIAHYKLNDDAASATVLDSTGVHNGTYKDAGGNENTANGSTANSRGVGTCLEFDHTNSEYIEIADHDDFSPGAGTAGSGTPFSISAYIFMDDATNFCIASKGVLVTDAEWRFDTEGADFLKFKFKDNSVGNCYIGRKYGTKLDEGVWLHVVGTYNGGTLSSGIKLYLNGVQVDDGVAQLDNTNFVAVENDLGHAVWIGNYNSVEANGLMDNVIFFNHELHEDQVKALYNGGHGTEIVEVIDLDRRIQRRQ